MQRRSLARVKSTVQVTSRASHGNLVAQVGPNLFLIPPQINSCPLLFVVQLPHAVPMKPQVPSLVAPSWPPSTVSSHSQHHSPVYTIPCPVFPLHFPVSIQPQSPTPPCQPTSPEELVPSINLGNLIITVILWLKWWGTQKAGETGFSGYPESLGHVLCCSQQAKDWAWGGKSCWAIRISIAREHRLPKECNCYNLKDSK